MRTLPVGELEEAENEPPFDAAAFEASANISASFPANLERVLPKPLAPFVAWGYPDASAVLAASFF